MTDKEKVVNGLKCCLHDEEDDHGRLCEECPYDRGDCRKDLYNDALALLKEQEYARCLNCQFRYFGENEVDSWDRCKLHGHTTSPDEYCSWFVERE